MIDKTRITISTLLLATLLPLGSVACDSDKEKEKVLRAQDFRKADSNQDGSLDLQEYFKSITYPRPQTEWKKIYTEQDKNKNGEIDADEYEPWAGSNIIPKCAGYVPQPAASEPILKPVVYSNMPKDTPAIPALTPNSNPKSPPPPPIPPLKLQQPSPTPSTPSIIPPPLEVPSPEAR